MCESSLTQLDLVFRLHRRIVLYNMSCFGLIICLVYSACWAAVFLRLSSCTIWTAPTRFNWFCWFYIFVCSPFLGFVHVLVCMDVSIDVRVLVSSYICCLYFPASSASCKLYIFSLSLSYDREIESIIGNSRKKQEQKPQKPLEHVMILNLK